MPMLSAEVVKGLDSSVKPVINFKGYLIGNGCTDEVYDGNAFIPFAYGMGLISDELYKEIIKECQGYYYLRQETSEICLDLLGKTDTLVEDINTYDILEPCYHGDGSKSAASNNTRLPVSFQQLGETERPLSVRKRMFGRAWPLGIPARNGIVPTWPQLSISVPCTDDTVATAWLNSEAVRKAIHAAPSRVSGPWELCTGRISFDQNAGSMIPYHKNLTSQGYRALIYSGDHDMCVPFTGSEAWTRSVGYKVIDEWRSWTSVEQVARFLQGYDKNLTFLTIKGAGHTVPEYKPRQSLDFYRRWLEGKSI